RGDTLNVSTLPFDRTSEKAAAQELKANNAAAAKAARMGTFRTIAIVGGLLFALLIAWLRGRRKNKARREATNYVIEHLQQDRALTAQQQRELENPASTLLGLEAGPQSPEDEIRQELVELVESQPEDVANLLRGWLVDR
ncbi:MAG: flagellar M-ring protein FliF, partial [Marmoricola sp.]|nr:flagellar M-ring protein FliF [Marmoricola sp.]